MRGERSFRGEYEALLDSGYRVQIPDTMRAGLGATVAMICLPGNPKNVVSVFSLSVWETLQKTLTADEVGLLGEPALLTRDTEHSLSIPPSIARQAGLAPHTVVLIIGVGNHIEVWAKERWEVFIQSVMPGFADTQWMEERP